MYNNTQTLSNQYNPSSNILDVDVNLKVESKKLSFEESIDALNILHSFELRKNKIRIDLNSFFDFANQSDELNFLDENPLIINILPSIASYIFGNLDNEAKLELDLLKEDSDLQTLFINIYTCVSWEKENDFLDKFLDNLYEFYPDIAQKLNLNFIPNEL
jgi:hypothetical protein